MRPVMASNTASVPKRQLCTVLVVDVVSYTRLMEVNEEDTYSRLLTLHSEVLNPGVYSHSGRIVKETGDGFLAIFDGAIEGARCAIALQARLREIASAEAEDTRLL